MSPLAHGLCVMPEIGASLTPFHPPSAAEVVLPMIMPPAAYSLVTTGASTSGTVPWVAAEAKSVWMPLVCCRSLMVNGMPSSSRGVPRFANTSSDRRAASSACSGVKRIIAFTRGSTASIRASTAWATSTGESLRARYSAESWLTPRKPISSAPMPVPPLPRDPTRYGRSGKVPPARLEPPACMPKPPPPSSKCIGS